VFKKYPKIHRLGKEEVDGILNGTCIIQEKVDGANTSIWTGEDGIHLASRSQEIKSGFNGFVDYVKKNEEINKLLTDHPEYRLYGEWLVRHSIQYNELAYKHFYLFDVMVGEDFLDSEEVTIIAQQYSIRYPQIFDVVENPSLEDVKKYLGKSSLGDNGEGVVIKNHDFFNAFGDCVYAKLVTEGFKEKNAIIFGGNNKHSESYWEVYVMNKYITVARVRKIMEKIEPTIDGRLGLEHTPRIANSVVFDLMQEEIWDIMKKVPKLDFRILKRICTKKAGFIYKDILNESISVAY
jgi:hypothetical protein